MSLTYLAGYDGSAASRAAVDLTRRLARATGARVVAAHVFPVGPPVAQPMGPGLVPRFDEDLAARAAESAERLLAGLGEDIEHRAVPDGSAPAGLHGLAGIERAALVAVGATSRGAIGRIVPGSIAERVIHGAECAVLAVPPHEGDPPIETILVPYDGREEAERALETAIALAERLGASLLLVAVVETALLYTRPGDDAARLDHELGLHLRDGLDHAVEMVDGRVPVRTELVVGSAREALVDIARSGADLVVSGSRAYGPLRSVLLGGVSRHLVDHAPCPVLVVPRGTTKSIVADEETADDLEVRPGA